MKKRKSAACPFWTALVLLLAALMLIGFLYQTTNRFILTNISINQNTYPFPPKWPT